MLLKILGFIIRWGGFVLVTLFFFLGLNILGVYAIIRMFRKAGDYRGGKKIIMYILSGVLAPITAGVFNVFPTYGYIRYILEFFGLD